MTSISTWTRDDLGPRTGDVTEHHRLVIRWDDDGYTRIHEDALGPLLRAADYQLEQTGDLRIDGTWLVEDAGEHTCGAGDVHGHEPGCGTIPVANLADLPGFEQLGQYLDGDPTADHQCRSTHHAGGAGLRRCTWWHNHPNSRRHSDGSYTWTDETRNPAPTEEAAALRSAPLANDDDQRTMLDQCTGASGCTAPLHVHGCYADHGLCNERDQHYRR